MGYVARSSEAVVRFVDGQTYIAERGERVALTPMTREALTDLRHSYYQENRTAAAIAYGDVHFSMNAGDYQKPIL